MPFHTWILFAIAYLVTTLSPGPNVLLVIRNTLRYGSVGTVTTIAGNLLAQLVVVILVAIGVGAVLAAMPPIFVGMKVIGSLYLAYLGLKQLKQAARQPTSIATATFEQRTGKGRIFREALLVSGSNPKTLIFLSAFMPQFLTANRPLSLQFFTMYLTISAIVMVVHSTYSTGVKRLHGRLGATRWVSAIKRLSGFIFVALSVKLLTARQA
ncbi:LysE family translocator [Paraburkholderia sp.]|uniref:LysE family translocator n=1 Tax=Paraburkholderia sp. TaxID=1926495 RepID=UPI0025CF5D40|nr:LysE family translocator [Paraburkholderia sp.]